MRAGSDRARRSVRIGKIMELTDIRELHREKDVYIGKEITVGGWVRNNRDSKNFGFLVINDGTFFEPLQVDLQDQCRCSSCDPRHHRGYPRGKAGI